MIIAEDIDVVRNHIKSWKADGEKIGFVPTMGNLHKGHISLISSLKQAGATKIIASIFVNPTQFSIGEDYTEYPRTFDSDQKKLRKHSIDLLFSPSTEVMYPKNILSELTIKYPEYNNILCGEHRPSHFSGVLCVVNKLFNIINPDIAVFGQKDYQQFILIKGMVRDLCMPIEMFCAPIVRESDGLALSSRNQYLSKQERLIAPKLYESLKEAKISIDNKLKIVDIENNAIDFLSKNNFLVDYFSVRRSKDLKKVDSNQSFNKSIIILTAVKIGRTRLIDNILIS
ncbi:MAG: pantoate--beta-alanine ligase [Alphaproteobacteria bacterium]|jgi:pantoate--beta-alanine ligase|tara:strand:+ start:36376 stop:37230 length:855 start_codon:yes stop_codon:yes gene_type:complete